MRKNDSRSAVVRRHLRLRKHISGTAQRPRLNVFRSLNNIYAHTMSNGKCLTARISESPKQGNGCILSDILISDVPEKYYLNQKQMEQLLFKSGQEVRGKESTVPKD